MNAHDFDKLGIEFGMKGNYESAIVCFNEALAIDPTYAPAYNNRGLSLYKLEYFKEAIEDYNEAIRLLPNVAIFYMNRGLAYTYLGDFRKGIQDFDTALSLGASEVCEAYQYRGEAYMQLGDYEKAIADFQVFATYERSVESSLREGSQLQSKDSYIDSESDKGG